MYEQTFDLTGYEPGAVHANMEGGLTVEYRCGRYLRLFAVNQNSPLRNEGREIIPEWYEIRLPHHSDG